MISFFSPHPELVRIHAMHLITYVLSQLPVQGKAALNRITAEIELRIPERRTGGQQMPIAALNAGSESILSMIVVSIKFRALRAFEDAFYSRPQLPLR
jgi:hypothetical protein